jgi:WD40 repeat protein
MHPIAGDKPSFSPDGGLLMVVRFPGVCLFSQANGSKVREIQDPGVNAAAWSSDGRRIILGFWNGTMRLIDAGTGTTLAEYGGHAGPVWAVACAADGKSVASACNDNKVRVFRVDAVAPATTTSSTNTFGMKLVIERRAFQSR